MVCFLLVLHHKTVINVSEISSGTHCKKQSHILKAQENLVLFENLVSEQETQSHKLLLKDGFQQKEEQVLQLEFKWDHPK